MKMTHCLRRSLAYFKEISDFRLGCICFQVDVEDGIDAIAEVSPENCLEPRLTYP